MSDDPKKMISPRPWRRGIGNDCHTVFDGQGSVVADRVGTIDGNLIAAAPDLAAEIDRLRAMLKFGCSTLALFNVKNYHPTLVTLQAHLLAGLEEKSP